MKKRTQIQAFTYMYNPVETGWKMSSSEIIYATNKSRNKNH